MIHLHIACVVEELHASGTEQAFCSLPMKIALYARDEADPCFCQNLKREY